LLSSLADSYTPVSASRDVRLEMPCANFTCTLKFAADFIAQGVAPPERCRFLMWYQPLLAMFLLLGCLGQAWSETKPDATSVPAPSKSLQGACWYLGDSILDGRDLKPGQKKYADLLTAKLNERYGPVTETRYSECENTAELCDQVESRLAGVTMSLCVLEIGMKNLTYRLGGPNVSTCGGCSLQASLLSSFHFGAELQKILSVIQKHMAPGGLILMTNLYKVDDCFSDHYENWEKYPQVLQMYNQIAAMAAETNGVKLVDLYALMAKNPSYIDSCGQYPNAAGHAAIADLLEKSVSEALASPPQRPPKK